MRDNLVDVKYLHEKAAWLWKETLLIHRRAPETRLASSLSPIEILTVLYYGGILSYNPQNPFDDERDRFVISKGHGSIAMYPILADLGFFERKELEKVCTPATFLGGIPDPIIPGYETISGSLGHGLGVGTGIAVALKAKGSAKNVFVLVGDGELNEGSNWEAIMFAAHHCLDNLLLIIDDNKIAMLDFTKNITGDLPFSNKFKAFGWNYYEVNGHNVEEVSNALKDSKELMNGKPTVIIANTVKGYGVPTLENAPLCHVKNIDALEIDSLMEKKLYE